MWRLTGCLADSAQIKWGLGMFTNAVQLMTAAPKAHSISATDGVKTRSRVSGHV